MMNHFDFSTFFLPSFDWLIIKNQKMINIVARTATSRLMVRGLSGRSSSAILASTTLRSTLLNQDAFPKAFSPANAQRAYVSTASAIVPSATTQSTLTSVTPTGLIEMLELLSSEDDEDGWVCSCFFIQTTKIPLNHPCTHPFLFV